jgi:hypothetical protein
MLRSLYEVLHEKRWKSSLAFCLSTLAVGLALTSCDSNSPKAAADAEKKASPPTAPAIPDEYQDAAKTMLGSDSEVLLFGDLAKNGKQEVLAANVVPNTPKSVVAGTVVTRAVIAEKSEDGKWSEVLRADEHLKNQKGFLGLTPLQAVTGWKLQYEQSPEKGLTLYFTPLKSGSSERTLPIAVGINPKTNRYQSMDPSYQHFLSEASTLDNPRSTVR